MAKYFTHTTKVSLIAVVGFTSSAFAANDQPDLSDLITDTNGYVTVRDNVLILEGDDFPTYMCKFEASDAAFENYKNTGKLGGEKIGYACIPIEEFEN